MLSSMLAALFLTAAGQQQDAVNSQVVDAAPEPVGEEVSDEAVADEARMQESPLPAQQNSTTILQATTTQGVMLEVGGEDLPDDTPADPDR